MNERVVLVLGRVLKFHAKIHDRAFSQRSWSLYLILVEIYDKISKELALEVRITNGYD